ncbi:type VI secretion system baseplate subunit TssF [Escherichia coli]|uniref:type VI secretion system baseplate subunit TssF n=1 Tax=Escherichia coli TaxID=562 RepID=UPI0005309972|nr:type VI secretion system baseplate subunit TssF [Escherichia coli]
MEFEERYFREELDYLRQLSKLLATEKPHLARFLAEKDADPDIERLLEGVAFLTGNLRQKIEDEFPELTHGLIKMLWPNYLRPVPAMTLIEYTPDMDKSSVPVLIPRNEQFTTNAGEIRVDEVLPSDAKKEEPPPCTFTLCRDIWLLPVRLEQIENRSTTRNGVINITFSVAPGTDFRTLDLNKLRFWLGNDDNYTRLDLLQGFAALFQSLNRQDRDAILGVTFTRRAHENDDWRTELNAFWQTWVDRMNLALPDLMVAQTHTRTSLFSFSRQMQGSREPLVSLLEGLLDGENMNVMLRGVYLTSSLQRGQMDDIFTQSAARQYRLGNNPLASWPLVDTAPYFTRSLFPQALLAEPNLATESRAWLIRSRRRLTVFSATGGVAALLLITGWHHYYNGNYQSGITVLKQAKAFMDVPPPQGEDDFGNLQLPLLNPVRDATLAYGDWGDRSRLADMGLYQGRRIGPYVEQTYLQLLEQRYSRWKPGCR